MLPMEELKKNQIYTSVIDGWSADGAGVCHISGRAVFVPRAIPGEVWDVKILKVSSSAVYGLGAVLREASPARLKPLCPYFGACGGCDTWHISYEEELRFKLGRVNDALCHVGGIDFEVKDIIPAESFERYRNKGIYAAADINGTAAAGFYRQRSHDLIRVDSCLIQNELADRAAGAVVRWMNENGVPAYNEDTGRGNVRHVFTRRAVHTADAVLCIVTARGFGASTQELVAYLRAQCPELTGIVLCVNKSRGNAILEGAFHTLWGSDILRDTLCGFSFSISPQAFFQINPPQAEKLYGRAVEYAALTGTETVLDLYCGAGTISMCLARGAKKVVGAEIVPEAVANAGENAAANGVSNAEFICADAGEAAAVLASRGLKPDVVVVDPPRKGMYPEAVDAVCGMKPQRVVYVSCNPATLARDISRFQSAGYELQAASAVDMFPRTSHVETVVQLSRKKPDDVIEIDLNLDELDATSAETKATYEEIKEYVLKETGLKVSSLYISQVKRKCGLEVGKSYNLPKSEKVTVPQCPKDKEDAIRAALKHFAMI
jgi:23S rRNA (uracil1939-C5)-methyltransferase